MVTASRLAGSLSIRTIVSVGSIPSHQSKGCRQDPRGEHRLKWNGLRLASGGRDLAHHAVAEDVIPALFHRQAPRQMESTLAHQPEIGATTFATSKRSSPRVTWSVMARRQR